MAHLNQPVNILIIQAVRQLPNQYPMEAFRAVLEFLPDLTNRLVVSEPPIQPDEHVTHIVFSHFAGKKPNVFLTDRPDIQQFALRVMRDVFREKLQGITGIFLMTRIRGKIFKRPTCSGSSQRSNPFAVHADRCG